MPSRREPPSGPRTVSFTGSRIRRPPGVAPRGGFSRFWLSLPRFRALRVGLPSSPLELRLEPELTSGNSFSSERSAPHVGCAEQYDFVYEVQSCFSSLVSKVFTHKSNAILWHPVRDASSIRPSTGLLPRGMRVQLPRVPLHLYPPGAWCSHAPLGSVA